MDEPNPEERIFESVLGLPPDERAAQLGKACAGDADLRKRVEELLRLHEGAGEFMEAPALQQGNNTIVVDLPVSERPGDRIGSYKILEKVGEGGFGVVYVAEQREPVRRRVALKIIKLGMDTRQVVARFEAERQALALMDHPNIAKVLEAGATGTGRPFFVMELVRGIKITEYCDQHQLSPRERLNLFVQVCRAIQHAHQKGIIHRDIKPSNILVTLHDGVPSPKVIDFGIAKATQGDLTDKTVYTQFQQFIGTPAYMSPEQAEMSGLDIDIRSDIYSLGVLLYELLTGRTPFDQKQLLDAGLDGMRRMIREQEPVRPSTRVSSLQGNERTTTASRRHTEPLKLISLLRGDLDWIVMKCLEKDRTRRYESASGLAMDIERYIANEPVLARPPSKLYRFQKTVRRNKAAFAAALGVFLALITGAVVSTWQAIRATSAQKIASSERDAATLARQQAEIMNRFLKVDLLEQATPDASAPEEMRNAMAAVLKRASARLEHDKEIARLPELEARLRLALGSTYFKLGVLDEAEKDLRRAVELMRASLGQTRETLAAQETLAWLLVGGVRKYDEGEMLSRETWQGRCKILGSEAPDTLDSMDTHAQALAGQRKYAEATPLLRQCLATRERVLGTNHVDTLTSLNNLGTMLQESRALPESERIFRDIIERHKSSGLAETPNAFGPINNLAMTLFLEGRFDEAISLLKDAIPRARQICGPETFWTLHIQHVLVRVLAEAGRLEEAEKLGRETLAIRRRATPGHEGTGRTLLYLGRVLVKQNKLEEANSLLREAWNLFRERYPKKTELAAEAANWLGAIQSARQAYSEAESLMVPGVGLLLDKAPVLSLSEQRAVIGNIIKLYQQWNKPVEIAAWQQKLDALNRDSQK